MTEQKNKPVRDGIFEPATSEDFPVRITVATGAQAYIYHWHESIEILYGLEGCTTVGVMDRPYQLQESDVLIICSGENHCLFPSDYRARRLVVMVEPSFLFGQKAFSADKECYRRIEKHSSQWPSEAKEKIRGSLSAIYREYYRQESGWKEYIYGMLMLMSSVVLRDLPQVEGYRRPQQDDLLRQTLSYLSEHYLEELTLESCAAALGFNPSYLSSLFKQKTGASFHQYLLNLRLNKAEWLLAHSERPIALVAEESGFASDKTFYRVFREKYGVSPTKFRKDRKG